MPENLTKLEARRAVAKYKESLVKEKIVKSKNIQERLNKSQQAIERLLGGRRRLNQKIKVAKARKKIQKIKQLQSVYSEIKRCELLSEFGSYPRVSILAPVGEPIRKKTLNHRINFLGGNKYEGAD